MKETRRKLAKIVKMLLCEILGQTKLIGRKAGQGLVGACGGGGLWDDIRRAPLEVTDVAYILIVEMVTLVFLFVRPFEMDALYCIHIHPSKV